MKYLGILVVIAVMLITCSAYATPIPGSTNELVNGNFETGTWAPWIHGAGLDMGVAGVGHNWAVFCKDPTGDLSLKQLPIDQSTNPLWNANGAFSTMNLDADIRDVWAAGDPGHPTSDIKFRLDWFGPGDENCTGTEHFSDWVTYTFTQNNVWQSVSPFTGFVPTWDGKPFQPRWVSVEVLIDQAAGETVWVDNLVLTSKCNTAVPEPMSVMLGMMGLGSMVGLRRVFGKK